MGESGSAGTHSCFMVLFQEARLDLLVFTGSQFVCVCVCVCIFASFFFRLGVGPLLFDHSSSLSQLPSHDSSSFEFHYIKQRLRAMFVQ